MLNVWKPIWARPGHTVVHRWTTDFVSTHGKRATIHWVEYQDPKGKSHDAVHYVKWLDE